MADIKLVYFDLRGRGEFIRLVLLASGHKFQDTRIPRDQWSPEEKAETPYGQVPYMIYNGKKYGQSIAIASFIARENGLYGKTNLDALRIDEVVLLADDLRSPLRVWRMENDEAKKGELLQKLKDETFPKFLGFFESLLIDNSSTGFFVGNTITLADLVVYDQLDTILGIDPEAIAAYPNLKKLRDIVEAVAAIKDYLATRPQTAI